MSVIGIDLGGKHCCVAQAKKGGISTVLNGASQRRSSSLVSIKGKQRSLASNADSMIKSNMKNTVWYISRLIGREWGSAELERELAYHPYPQLFGESKKTPGQLVAFLNYDGQVEEYTPPQIMAMLLGQLQREATAQLPGDLLSDIVISVPSWYTNAQRRQMLAASEIAGLNCYGLLNDTTAAALNYGIWKNAKGEFKESKDHYCMFINCGATQFSCSIVLFREGGMVVKSNTYDRFLGGRDIDMKLAEILADGFKEQTKIDVSRASDAKAFIKVLMQAEKTKKNLCGGVPMVKVNIECLKNDRDLRNFPVKLETLNEICEPLAERMLVKIKQALDETGLEYKDLKAVELTGSSMRLPIFKKKISAFFGIENATAPNFGLNTTMDVEEAQASGCALMCATLSPKFNVKAFEVIDCCQYPVNVSWEQPDVTAEDDDKMEVDEEGDDATNSVSSAGTNVLTLFPRNGGCGTRKIAFRRNKPFTLTASYDGSVAGSESFPGGTTEVAKFDISGMPEAGTAGEIPRVRVYLSQDVSGVLRAESAIYMEEKKEEPEPTPAEDDNKKEDAADDGKKEGEADEGKKGGDDANEGGQSGDVEEPPKKKKKRYKRVSLKVEATYSGAVGRDVMIDQQSIEANLAGTDRMIREISDARNDLETFVYEFRDKLDGNLNSFSTEEERESVKGRLASEEDWLYTDEADETSKSGFQGKLKELMTLVEPITNRETEANGRGHACNELRKLTQFYLGIVNGSDEKYDHLTDEERDTVRKACGEADTWLSNLQEKQMALAPSVDPILKIKDISNKWSETDKVCKPIVTRKKPAPKVEEPKKDEAAAGEKSGETTDDAGKKADGENADAPTEEGSKDDAPKESETPGEDSKMD